MDGSVTSLIPIPTSIERGIVGWVNGEASPRIRSFRAPARACSFEAYFSPRHLSLTPVSESFFPAERNGVAGQALERAGAAPAGRPLGSAWSPLSHVCACVSQPTIHTETWRVIRA